MGAEIDVDTSAAKEADAQRSTEYVTIAVTGAAGQIAYAMLPRLLSGTIFGNKMIKFRLMNPSQDKLAGVVYELEDLASERLSSIVCTSDPRVAFEGADVAILLGAMPRKPGMERADLLARNSSIFAEQGRALGEVGKPTCKVLVVGNPANTNAAILAQHAAPRIPASNISALTRLDQNRLKAQLARRCEAECNMIRRAVIWGNHSSTQFPDVSRVTVRGQPLDLELADSAFALWEEDEAEEAPIGQWARGELVTTVQQRGAAVLKLRKMSSAMSAASACIDHLHDLFKGSEDWVSMAVPSEGEYNVPRGIWFSFPCVCTGDGKYEIVKDLTHDEFAQAKMTRTADELVSELKEATKALLTSTPAPRVAGS